MTARNLFDVSGQVALVTGAASGLGGAIAEVLAAHGAKLALLACAQGHPGYDTAIKTYCELQYNYLLKTEPAEIFNPYAHLAHDTLKSNTYAFSIDDKRRF